MKETGHVEDKKKNHFSLAKKKNKQKNGPEHNSHTTKTSYKIKMVTKRIIIESDERQSEWRAQEVSGVFLFFIPHKTVRCVKKDNVVSR